MIIFYSKGTASCEVPEDAELGMCDNPSKNHVEPAVRLSDGRVFYLRVSGDWQCTTGYAVECQDIGKEFPYAFVPGTYALQFRRELIPANLIYRADSAHAGIFGVHEGPPHFTLSAS